MQYYKEIIQYLQNEFNEKVNLLEVDALQTEHILEKYFKRMDKLNNIIKVKTQLRKVTFNNKDDEILAVKYDFINNSIKLGLNNLIVSDSDQVEKLKVYINDLFNLQIKVEENENISDLILKLQEQQEQFKIYVSNASEEFLNLGIKRDKLKNLVISSALISSLCLCSVTYALVKDFKNDEILTASSLLGVGWFGTAVYTAALRDELDKQKIYDEKDK